MAHGRFPYRDDSLDTRDIEKLFYSDQSSCPKLYWNYDGRTKVEEKDSNSKPSNNSSNHSFNKSMDTMSGDPNDCLLRLLVL